MPFEPVGAGVEAPSSSRCAGAKGEKARGAKGASKGDQATWRGYTTLAARCPQSGCSVVVCPLQVCPQSRQAKRLRGSVAQGMVGQSQANW